MRRQRHGIFRHLIPYKVAAGISEKHMAPQTAAQNINIWSAALGGAPVGGEDQLVVTVRKRLNLKFAQVESVPICAVAFAFGVEPVF